ncbi:protein phosphatase CheZ [Pseudaquidulcibacter saccharophilus]|uniref:protein phosphatase CheZ n=1 Tax=Pseudaquidulcibacter saccharophilus TaxID=2831900 RepID=UPI001EFF5938|nr:protein phosphatase CheZ [Pseudaquidulcibacter saccharophilus]
MAAPEVVLRVKDALSRLKDADLKDPRLGEVLTLASQMSDAMMAFFGSMDNSLYGELRYLSAYIQRTRAEISALRPNDIKNDGIPTAGAELDAIVANTAEATHRIMEAAESVMSADTSDAHAYQAFVCDKMLEIFEACSFQDITGQRVKKVVDTLRHIENRIDRFAKVMGVEDAEVQLSPEEQRKKDLLLNGPALNGPENKQDDIDAMFGGEDAGAAMSQDDLDALFD